MADGRTVLITGGSGLIGQHLREMLRQQNYQVKILSRSQSSAPDMHHWDWRSGQIDYEVLEQVDHVIHLAGANIGEKRWTSRRRLLIRESRVRSAAFLLEAFRQVGQMPRTYLSASAIGYFGAVTSDHIYGEDDPPGMDFLAETTVAWEQVVEAYGEHGVRTLIVRLGVVLAAAGMLQQVSAPLRWRLEIVPGHGRQYLAWIHIHDVCRMMLFLLETSVWSGTFHAVSPHHLRMGDFMHLLRRHLGKNAIRIHVPATWMKIALGDMSSIMLEGSRISSAKIQSTGFVFAFDTLEKALDNLLPS